MEKRKVLSRWEWVMLIIALVILLTVILRKFGINMIYTTDDTEMIHHTRD